MEGFNLFRRGRKLPADQRPPLESGERVLGWARVADGEQLVVVTDRGLWLPGDTARLGWHDIHKAVWSGRDLAVTPAELVEERPGYRVVADGTVRTYLLVDPGDVPNQVRARVTRSVAYTAHQQVPGGGLRIAARRVRGVDGLTWTVRYDPGTSADDPVVVTETNDLVVAAQSGTDPDL
ncbi:hypothetical protein [Plantactinospora endophytica]|uniref:Uncharacterized protein n=1 Tax=Plantactinospora endophytica TaxID=673535 RepID=A0ABQ4EDG9_9ACTN|nr:hypothetical protein [Plantactinospora endophytica]GIG92705.1 hypothetical protein Pen02_76410 [Plantactinospora endophytica]